eukprot:Sro60_g034660.1 n/a (866) ;mRNA; r:61793-64390
MYAVFSGDEEYDSPSGSDGTGGGGLQDLDEFTFNVAGISIDAETVQEACPDEFDMTFQCIIRDCPFFLDVCPNFTEDLGSGMADTVPSCEELDQGLCDLYGGEPECCITDCFTELQGLLVCAISELTGEDRSDCAAPTCATSTSDSGGGGGGPNDMDEGGGLLDTFDVWFAGVQIDASVAENACPVEWLVLVTTVITQCPNFLDVCPSALEGSPGNSDNNGAVPACPAFNQQICRELDFQKQDPGCCLDVATYQLYDLTLCIIRETTGEDLSTCGLPDCVTAATALPEGGHDGADIGDAFVGALTSAINITGFDVDIFGTKLSPALNIDIPECNYDWFWTLGCIKEQCSNFLEVCRDPNAAPNTNVSFVMGGASPQTCTELETGICDPLSRFPVGCCFSDCILPLYTLASCVVDNAIPDKEIRECRPPCLVDWLVGPGLQLAGAVPPTAEDLALFEFDFFGKNLTGRDAEAQCNDETSKTIDCVKKDCPNFFWSCARDLAGFPYAVNTDPDALFSSSAAPLDLTPANFGCTNFTDTFCELFKVSEACCLSKCMAPMYDLAACMIDFAIGDNSNLAGGCSAPQCVADYGDAYNPSVGIIPVAVNSSFLISTLETITAAALLAQLNDGDNVALQVLLDAYRACVQAAVDSLNTDSGGRQLGHLPTVDGIPHRQLQTLPPEFDPNSAEIYNFMDTPCDDTSATVSKQGGGTAQQQQQTCITVFGKYKLSVDPQDNPQAVYERFEEATTTAISTGVLQDKLQEAAAVQANNNVGNATNNTAASFVSPFVVQGVSTVVDESFVAISPLEIPATPDASRPELGATDNATGNTGTNNATAAPTEAPDSGASSLWRSAATALLAIPFCIALLS